MHRGIELRSLPRAGVFPPLRHFGESKLLTRVHAPKTAWLGPRIQHTTIEEDAEVRFVEEGLDSLGDEDLVYPLSAAQVDSRWNALMRAVGVPHRRLTPRSLRGGGTCWLWDQTKDHGLVLWRGRWTSEKSLVFYLQEALVSKLLGELSGKTQSRILSASFLYDRLIRL